MSYFFDLFIVYIYLSIVFSFLRIILGIYGRAWSAHDCVYSDDDVPPTSIFMFLYIAPQWPRPKFWRRWKEGEWSA